MADTLARLPDDDMESAREDRMPGEEPETPAPRQRNRKEHTGRLVQWAAYKVNIAEELRDEHDPILEGLGQTVIEEAEIDDNSRAEWKDKTERGIEMAMQVAKKKAYPWPGASSVVWPMMTEAAEQFAARAYPAIVVNRSVVKGIITGSDEGTPAIDPQTQMPLANPQTGEPVWQVAPGEKQMRADAIGEHMSWQCLEEMPEWEEELDVLLNVLPIVGCEFKKSYFSEDERRNKSVRVPAMDLIINYKARSIYTVPRLTEILRLYPHEIEEYRRSGFYLDQDYGPDAAAEMNDKDAPVTFYEQHRRIDMDGDGYAEPYIVTVAKDSKKVARIVARYRVKDIDYDEDTGDVMKITPIHYYTRYIFMPSKDGGIYGQGFAQSLLGINSAVNSTLNMLIDAGHLQNTGGGFIGKGLSLASGAVRFKPGEYKPVNAMGNDIRKAIVPLEHKGPSPVLFQLLGTLIEAGKDISSVKDVLTGEIKAQTMSPTVFLALVEQGTKVFTAIYKRVHRSLKAEFEKLYRLNREHLGETADYKVGEEWKQIGQEVYARGAGVEPVSDPTMVADAQRMGQANFLWEMGKADPYFDPLELRRRVLKAGNVERAETMLLKQQPQNPELGVKVAELAQKQAVAKADIIEKVSSAIKNMADADSKVAETFSTWMMNMSAELQGEVSKLGTGNGNTNGAAGGGGNGPGPVQRMAQPPDNAGVPPVPPGPGGGPEPQAPGPMGA